MAQGECWSIVVSVVGSKWMYVWKHVEANLTGYSARLRGGLEVADASIELQLVHGVCQLKSLEVAFRKVQKFAATDTATNELA
jgi:hypothetical protein